MSLDIAVQNATSFTPVPSDQQFTRWVSAALHKHGDAELLIRLVDRQESRQLNARYRRINKATNVLSFPADMPREVALPLLGVGSRAERGSRGGGGGEGGLPPAGSGAAGRQRPAELP